MTRGNNTMREHFKVGIIGTGHGVRTIAPALMSTDAFEITAVSGSSVSRAQEVVKESLPNAKALDFGELLESSELDLICVASPNEFHAQHMAAAAQTDRHLYLEKPIGNSAIEAAEVEALVAQRPKSLLTVVGHQLRFNPFLKEIRDKWREGDLGDVYSVVIRQRGGAFASSERPWTWEFEKERGGGVRLAMGTHLVDLVNFMSGKTPSSTFVNMDPVHERRSPTGDVADRIVDVCNFFSATLDYGDFEAYVTTSAASHGPGMFEIEILGSKGTLYFDGVGKLTSFVEGTEQASWFTAEAVAEYQKRPGSSIFRKSLSVLAEEMAKFMRGEENSIDDAASVTESVRLLEVLDSSMNDFNARIARNSEMF